MKGSLIVESNIKQKISAEKLRISPEYLVSLNKLLEKQINKHMKRARRNGRTTVMDKDL